VSEPRPFPDRPDMGAPPQWEMLVLGGTVLTMEEGAAPIPQGAVAVGGGRILAVGPAEELLELAPTGEVLNASGCIILPGLVNTHSHLAMTLLRGIADDIPLKEWLEDHIWPAERQHMRAETVRVGTQLAAAEQLLAGVTTTTDMYFFGLEVAEALAATGMRALVAETVIDFPTPSCATVDEMMARQLRLIAGFAEHPLVTPSVAAHAPYSVSATNLVRAAELAEEHELPLQVHLAETRWEVQQLLEDKRLTPAAYLADLGVLSERTVAAHCVHLSPDDIALLAELEVKVSHNPISNLKLGSGVAPVPALLAAGVTVGFGTDGAASNNTLDLLRDAQVAALLHKGVAGDPTTLPARSVVDLLTLGGARVLGLENRIGTLTPGKEADLICLSTDGPHATPSYDPYSHLVCAARSSDVRHVLVRGRVLVRDRRLVTLDLERVRAEALAIARTIR
jgi:5-methylthioadenosine/S-adenosylhomocysteine deaminase